jgi:hypothetical protein
MRIPNQFALLLLPALLAAQDTVAPTTGENTAPVARRKYR